MDRVQSSTNFNSDKFPLQLIITKYRKFNYIYQD